MESKWETNAMCKTTPRSARFFSLRCVNKEKHALRTPAWTSRPEGVTSSPVCQHRSVTPPRINDDLHSMDISAHGLT